MEINLGSAAWAVGVCSVAGVLIVCLTVLVILRRQDAVEVLKAFAEVIKAFRKQPKIVLSGDPPDGVSKLPRAS